MNERRRARYETYCPDCGRRLMLLTDQHDLGQLMDAFSKLVWHRAAEHQFVRRRNGQEELAVPPTTAADILIHEVES